MHEPPKSIFRVVGKKRELDAVVTLHLVLEDGQPVPSFISGQYINVFLPSLSVAEGKSYSISSVPADDHLSITVKEIGEFSTYLCNLEIGDTLEASHPYGYFYSEDQNSTLVFIIGGISITPVMSMLRSFVKHNSRRDIELFYSNSFVHSILFKEELESMVTGSLSLKMHFFITKETEVQAPYVRGRISPDAIVEARNIHASHAECDEYFISGSIHFVRDMWNGLRALGVNEERIATEAFFSH